MLGILYEDIHGHFRELESWFSISGEAFIRNIGMIGMCVSSVGSLVYIIEKFWLLIQQSLIALSRVA